MTSLHEFRILFVAVTGILVLLVASPALSRLLVFPRTDYFTELWILDSNHKAENYPFNVARNQSYNVFLGIGNHLGYCSYYLIEVKFRNQTQSAPNSFNRTCSSLPALYNITVFVADEGTRELPFGFSFEYEYGEMFSGVKFSNLTLNGVNLDLSNYAIKWDSGKKVFLGNLFFELWIYNSTMSSFQYHERSVGLWFNMTTF